MESLTIWKARTPFSVICPAKWFSYLLVLQGCCLHSSKFSSLCADRWRYIRQCNCLGFHISKNVHNLSFGIGKKCEINLVSFQGMKAWKYIFFASRRKQLYSQKFCICDQTLYKHYHQPQKDLFSSYILHVSVLLTVFRHVNTWLWNPK
jgi:hypothetical protein